VRVTARFLASLGMTVVSFSALSHGALVLNCNTERS